MPDIGKLFIIFGLILTVVGLVISLSGKIPFLGKLPGDIRIEREGFSFFFPLGSCLVISILVTFVLWLFRR